MALQVWLPLNGNLNNQGIGGLTFSADSPTVVDSSGKIGSCYKNTSNTSGGIVSGQTINLGSKQSMFCWFKFTSLESQSSLGGGLVSQHRYANNSGMGITIRYVSSTTGYLSVNTGNGSSRTYNAYYGTTLLQANTWYHGGYTYDGSTIRIYVNGVLEKEQAYSGMFVPADYITVFGWSMYGSGGTGIYSDYKFNGSINDVRVYDHCLSPKEVKEISKGLVLHYKLDEGSLKGSGNLVNGLNGGGQCTISGSTVTVSGTNADTYFYIKTSTALTSGKTYKISCIGNFADGKYYYFPIGGQSNTGPGQLVVKNGYCSMVFVANNAIANAGTTIILDDTTRSPGAGTISNIMLEEIVGISDCSGYSYNGTSTGYLSISNNTPRYIHSTSFDGSTTKIAVPFNYSYWGNDFTISAWLKSNVNSGGYLTAVGNELSNGGIVFGELTRVNTLQCYLNAASGGADMNICSYTSFAANTWYHLVYTVKNALTLPSASMYVNGNLVTTKDSTSPYGEPNLPVYIGCNGTYRFWNGDISDFRIYSTALSADDIKELYDTSAIIYNDGTVAAREFSEGTNNIAAGAETARINKTFADGLSRYTQTHCQCTLTDDGFRIYRTPNLVYPDAGTVMWGGFVLDNTDNRFNFQTGHTYMIQFEIKGQTSNSVPDIYWTNYVGWGGGELYPHPSNVMTANPVTSNYNNSEWRTFTYKWTINDDVWKTCTESYQVFVAGQTYVTYKGFKYGFSYTSTGALGTDLYIKNIRMYDITNQVQTDITKTGIIDTNSLTEEVLPAEITMGGIVGREIIEI